MKEIKAYLPIFTGFYGTIFGDFENEEDQILEHLKLTSDEVEFQYSEYRISLSKEYVSYIDNEIDSICKGFDIVFEEVRSPRFYNFTNDVINCTYKVTDEAIAYLKDYAFNQYTDEFTQYLERFEPRAGFHSFYSDNIEVWKDEYFGKIYDDSVVFVSLLEFMLINEDIFDSLKNGMWEYGCGNTSLGYDLLITSTIESDDDDIYVECPKCKNCETHPIDEQRWHLQSFEIEGIDFEEGKIASSHTKCVSCGTHFKTIWDYSNTVTS